MVGAFVHLTSLVEDEVVRVESLSDAHKGTRLPRIPHCAYTERRYLRARLGIHPRLLWRPRQVDVSQGTNDELLAPMLCICLP